MVQVLEGNASDLFLFVKRSFYLFIYITMTQLEKLSFRITYTFSEVRKQYVVYLEAHQRIEKKASGHVFKSLKFPQILTFSLL